MSEPAANSLKQNPTAGKRSLARLAAVQALYQIELAGNEPEAVIAEFLAHRLGQEVDGEQYADADRAFFRALVVGGSERREDIDRSISAALPADWPLARDLSGFGRRPGWQQEESPKADDPKRYCLGRLNPRRFCRSTYLADSRLADSH